MAAIQHLIITLPYFISVAGHLKSICEKMAPLISLSPTLSLSPSHFPLHPLIYVLESVLFL
jgi:hypothetical protein